jgi:type I restriction enzyme S subunit
MRYLFTYGPVSIEEAESVPLKETEIGLVPEHWEVVRLGEVADIKGGKRLPKGHKLSDRPTPYPYIRVVDFKDGSVDKTNLKYLTPQDYENIKQYTISSRDVYISIAGTIGLVGIVPPELDGANLTENAAKIVLRDQAKVDPHFLVYFLASEIGQEQILIRTTKTSQPKLALARIRQIPIPYPSAGEQQEIARILKVVDKKLQAEEARKQGLEELFKTLLHNLMTGKIRVKDLNLYNTEEVMECHGFAGHGET